ncbi:MAG: glutaredoxin family protein [Burkholderiaceae bacterium]
MRRALIGAMAMAALAVSATASHAQYKWQATDGGIVYSDLPPPPDVRLIANRQGRPATSTAEANLPFALKAAMSAHPVTLYTAPDCPPCKSGRDLLAGRGVPFSEKTVATSADLEAYKSLGFADASFPGVVVGHDRSTGFEPGTWNRLLDAAGYPKSSMLSSQYKRAEARPLTEPPAQKLTVVVREEQVQPVAADARAAPNPAIERYRQAMQEADAKQRRAQQPDIRF